MTRQLKNILKTAVNVIEIGLAIAVLVLGVLSLSKKSYAYISAIAYVGCAYNLVSAVSLYVSGSKKSRRRQWLLYLLAFACLVFGLVAQKGL